MSNTRNVQFLEKYKCLTIDELQHAIYGESLNMKPQTECWNAFVVNQQARFKEQMTQNAQKKKFLDQQKISKYKYDALIRMHQKEKDTQTVNKAQKQTNHYK